MTIAQLMDQLAAESHRSSIYLGDGTTLDTGADDYKDVLRWVKMALRIVQDAGDWQAHKASLTLSAGTSPALTAGTYTYLLTTLLSDFRKLQADSMRYGNTMLTWIDDIEELDRIISSGPAWKDAATANGTPRYASLMGNSLILAPKPSTDFLTANPTISGYYYKSEAMTSVTATLLMPEGFFPYLVECALQIANRQEDDVNWQFAVQKWVQQQLPLLRGYDLTPKSDEELSPGDDLVLGIEGLNRW